MGMNWFTQLQNARSNSLTLADSHRRKASNFAAVGNNHMCAWLMGMAEEIENLANDIKNGIELKLIQGEEESKEAFEEMSNCVVSVSNQLTAEGVSPRMGY